MFRQFTRKDEGKENYKDKTCNLKDKQGKAQKSNNEKTLKKEIHVTKISRKTNTRKAWKKTL